MLRPLVSSSWRGNSTGLYCFVALFRAIRYLCISSTLMLMKSSGTTRWCALFPWLFRNLEMNASKDVSSGGMAMVELRGLGEVSCYERASAAGLSYISLRDVLAAQKRRPSNLTSEVNDLDGLWVSNNNHGTPRTPKSRLLEKAARAWLQPTISDRSLQHSNFFARYWMKCTSHIAAAAAPRALHHTRSGTNLSNCIVYFPFLKCFDMTPSESYSRDAHVLPLLCY